MEWVHDALGGAEATLVGVMLDYSRPYEASLTVRGGVGWGGVWWGGA